MLLGITPLRTGGGPSDDAGGDGPVDGGDDDAAAAAAARPTKEWARPRPRAEAASSGGLVVGWVDSPPPDTGAAAPYWRWIRCSRVRKASSISICRLMFMFLVLLWPPFVVAIVVIALRFK